MIKQCKFSNRVKHFKNDFLIRWNLNDYSNNTDPCAFVGLYDKDDLEAIKNHKGIKIYIPTGTLDFKQNQLYINDLLNEKDIFFVKDWWTNYPNKQNVKNINIPIKNYSMFEPKKLGDKIYCYLGVEKSKIVYGFNLVEKIKKETPFEIIYGFRDFDKNLPIEKLKNDYYDQCFLNLNFSTSGLGGFTTVFEFAYMGIKSITTSNKKEKFLINFEKEEDIKNIIKKESEKIGTIQQSLIDDYFIDKDWLNINFWLI
jgi:hypothetical protein